MSKKNIVERMRERYDRDDAFKALVDVMTMQILNLQLAPSEVREAAMYAVYRAEILFPPHRFRDEDELREAMRKADERAASHVGGEK